MNIETLKSKWEEVSGREGYTFYRKLVNGRGAWYAVKGEDVLPITYEQARGYEPITGREALAMKLGKLLLPR